MPQSQQNNSKPRIDYVDLAKGFAILWIIWIHTDHPEFGNFRNPLFFFLSGIFFKPTDVKTFFVKRWYSILLPFLFFYLASIPFRFVVDLWDYRSLNAFDWSRVLDIFKVVEGSDYLSLNVPLWFLLTLFFIQLFSLAICRCNRWIILAISSLSLLFHSELLAIPSPFMINNAAANYGYLGMGFLMGKPLINYLSTAKIKTVVLSISALVTFGCVAYLDYGLNDLHGMIEKFKQLSFIIALISFFSFFNGVKLLEFLRFFGKESLLVLGAHMWILYPLKRLSFKLFQIHDPALGFCMAFITALILIPVIKILNNQMPLMVGKHKPTLAKAVA